MQTVWTRDLAGLAIRFVQAYSAPSADAASILRSCVQLYRQLNGLQVPAGEELDACLQRSAMLELQQAEQQPSDWAVLEACCVRLQQYVKVQL